MTGSTNVQNKSPYLRTSRNFPTDSQALSVEISKAYLDLANNVNVRSIGIFADAPTITGNSWFFGGSTSKMQTLREAYSFTGPSPVSITHGIKFNTIIGFVSIYGTFTDGSNWYPLPYVDVVSATNQVNVVVNPTNIVITAGSGSPPTISSGYVVIEWLSNV